MLETPFPFFISKKPGEIPIFGTFLAKKFNFGLHFAENQHSQVHHVLLHHYDVIRWLIFMILVSMERRDTALCYGTKQLYFGVINFKFTGGHPPPPPRKMCYKKRLRKMRVNVTIFILTMQGVSTCTSQRVHVLLFLTLQRVN